MAVWSVDVPFTRKQLAGAFTWSSQQGQASRFSLSSLPNCHRNTVTEDLGDPFIFLRDQLTLKVCLSRTLD